MHPSELHRREQLFVKTCHQRGLKITPQRVAVYRALIESDQHPTADVMYRKVKTTYPHISFDTVNRTLLTLAGTEIHHFWKDTTGGLTNPDA